MDHTPTSDPYQVHSSTDGTVPHLEATRNLTPLLGLSLTQRPDSAAGIVPHSEIRVITSLLGFFHSELMRLICLWVTPPLQTFFKFAGTIDGIPSTWSQHRKLTETSLCNQTFRKGIVNQVLSKHSFACACTYCSSRNNVECMFSL